MRDTMRSRPSKPRRSANALSPGVQSKQSRSGRRMGMDLASSPSSWSALLSAHDLRHGPEATRFALRTNAGHFGQHCCALDGNLSCVLDSHKVVLLEHRTFAGGHELFQVPYGSCHLISLDNQVRDLSEGLLVGAAEHVHRHASAVVVLQALSISGGAS